MAKVLSLANQKGGVGKTTTAINLSAGLALAGHRVLLVDIDSQANATSGLGLGKDGKLGTMNVLLKPERVLEAIAKGVLPRLDVLPGSPMLVNIDRTIGGGPRPRPAPETGARTRPNPVRLRHHGLPPIAGAPHP